METKNFLTSEQQELVAIGAAIAANCTPCLRAHIAKAVEIGLNFQQVGAAVAIGQAVKNAPNRHVNEAWLELSGAASPSPEHGKVSCCS